MVSRWDSNSKKGDFSPILFYLFIYLFIFIFYFILFYLFLFFFAWVWNIIKKRFRSNSTAPRTPPLDLPVDSAETEEIHMYIINPKYWDRQDLENSVDPDQTPLPRRLISFISHQSTARKCIHIRKTCLFKYTANFTIQKMKIFRLKFKYFFHISAQSIECGYSLEPPLRGEYPQSMFSSINKKNNVYTP